MDLISLEYTDVFDDNKSKKVIFSKELLKDGFKEKSLMALLVDGKSMQPLINDRAVIIADLSQKDLIHESIYLVYYENRMWVKRYDLINEKFISINPDFHHLVYRKDDVHLVARVILTFTNL